VYRLVGVCIHRGTADHGHYWSLINTERGHKEPDPYTEQEKWEQVDKCNWRKFDDESNSTFFTSNLQGEAFGGDSSSMTEAEVQTFVSGDGRAYGKSAYMLVYERKQKTPIRIVDIS
jgi:hypothetical protein